MRRVVVLVVGVVAILATAVAWLQRPDHITAAEAVRAAEGAFAAAGLDEAAVERRPVADTYDAGDGRDPIPVWRTTATLEDADIELWLSREDGEAVFLDDRTRDGSGQVLTAAQFEALADHHENPALGRQVRRDLVATAAAALILGTLGLVGRLGARTTDLAREHR